MTLGSPPWRTTLIAVSLQVTTRGGCSAPHTPRAVPTCEETPAPRISHFQAVHSRRRKKFSPLYPLRLLPVRGILSVRPLTYCVRMYTMYARTDPPRPGDFRTWPLTAVPHLNRPHPSLPRREEGHSALREFRIRKASAVCAHVELASSRWRRRSPCAPSAPQQANEERVMPHPRHNERHNSPDNAAP